MLAVSGATDSGQLNEAQSAQFSDAASDKLPVGHPELPQIGKRHRQLAILFAAVIKVLDLKPIEDASAGQTENAEGGRAQHRGSVRDELTDLVAHAGWRPLAYAIMRERTQERTSCVGGIG